MDFVQKINQKIKSKPNDGGIAKVYYFLMKEMNQPYSEILKMPIPLAFKLMDIAKEENDKMKKEQKKGGKKWR